MEGGWVVVNEGDKRDVIASCNLNVGGVAATNRLQCHGWDRRYRACFNPNEHNGINTPIVLESPLRIIHD